MIIVHGDFQYLVPPLWCEVLYLVSKFSWLLLVKFVSVYHNSDFCCLYLLLCRYLVSPKFQFFTCLWVMDAMIDLLVLQYFLQLSVSLEKIIVLFMGLGSRNAGLWRKIVIQSYSPIHQQQTPTTADETKTPPPPHTRWHIVLDIPNRKAEIQSKASKLQKTLH